jgi:hypothetical protein
VRWCGDLEGRRGWSVVAESKSAAPCSGISLQYAVFIAGPGPLLTKRSVRCQMPMPECASLNEDCVDRDGNTFLLYSMVWNYGICSTVFCCCSILFCGSISGDAGSTAVFTEGLISLHLLDQLFPMRPRLCD